MHLVVNSGSSWLPRPHDLYRVRGRSSKTLSASICLTVDFGKGLKTLHKPSSLSRRKLVRLFPVTRFDNMNETSTKRVIYFVGADLGHAVTNKIHDLVAAEVGIEWYLKAIDNPSLEEFINEMRSPHFGGAVITMPHKMNIMQHLDRIDEVALILGACNNVYRAPDGALTGTNTDWIGIRDSFSQLVRQHYKGTSSRNFNKMPGFGLPSFVIGAGGAARAAVHALHHALGSSKVYVINRDQGEVESLMKDIRDGYQRLRLQPPEMIHLGEVLDASAVEGTFYGVGTVPDSEPQTPQENKARKVLEELLKKSKGIFLDMCYKPRVTRNIRIARAAGWLTGYGEQVVTWQLKIQWELWAGNDISDAIPLEKMARRVNQIAEDSHISSKI